MVKKEYFLKPSLILRMVEKSEACDVSHERVYNGKTEHVRNSGQGVTGG